MPFTAAPKVLCLSCKKTVYPNEELRMSETQIYHKNCFRCVHCNKILQNTNFSQMEGIVYCKPHFMQLFRERGSYNDLAQHPNAPTGAKAANAAAGVSKPSSTFVRASSLVTDEKSNSNTGSYTAQEKTNFSAQQKDLNSILRNRSPNQVKDFIAKHGLHVIFKAGFNGVTPLEQAFSSSNAECGRVMMQILEDALKTKEFEWEKSFESPIPSPVEPAMSSPVESAPAALEVPASVPEDDSASASSDVGSPVEAASTPVQSDYNQEYTPEYNQDYQPSENVFA